MARRIHVRQLNAGSIRLDPDQAHHLRDVLRLEAGEPIEAFDDAGGIGAGTIDRIEGEAVWLRIESLRKAATVMQITIASALPKGQRADWMIEKLSELGVDRFIPLRTARSVVEPAGRNKLDRWARIAIESAKQSRRGGVMKIDPLTSLGDVMKVDWETSVYLSTEPAGAPIFDVAQSKIQNPQSKILLLVGPEGGWTAEEIAAFGESGLTGVKLTGTILRIETAAVAAAAIVASIRDSQEIS